MNVPKRVVTWRGSEFTQEYPGEGNPYFEEEIEVQHWFVSGLDGKEAVSIDRVSLTFQQWIDLAEAILAERNAYQAKGGEIVNGVRPWSHDYDVAWDDQITDN